MKDKLRGWLCTRVTFFPNFLLDTQFPGLIRRGIRSYWIFIFWKFWKLEIAHRQKAKQSPKPHLAAKKPATKRLNSACFIHWHVIRLNWSHLFQVYAKSYFKRSQRPKFLTLAGSGRVDATPQEFFNIHAEPLGVSHWNLALGHLSRNFWLKNWPGQVRSQLWRHT